MKLLPKYFHTWEFHAWNSVARFPIKKILGRKNHPRSKVFIFVHRNGMLEYVVFIHGNFTFSCMKIKWNFHAWNFSYLIWDGTHPVVALCKASECIKIGHGANILQDLTCCQKHCFVLRYFMRIKIRIIWRKY